MEMTCNPPWSHECLKIATSSPSTPCPSSWHHDATECNHEVARLPDTTVLCWWPSCLIQPPRSTVSWFSFYLKDHTGTVWVDKEPAKELEIVWSLTWEKPRESDVTEAKRTKEKSIRAVKRVKQDKNSEMALDWQYGGLKILDKNGLGMAVAMEACLEGLRRSGSWESGEKMTLDSSSEQRNGSWQEKNIRPREVFVFVFLR